MLESPDLQLASRVRRRQAQGLFEHRYVMPNLDAGSRLSATHDLQRIEPVGGTPTGVGIPKERILAETTRLADVSGERAPVSRP